MGENSSVNESDIVYCETQLNETTENVQKCLKLLNEYLIKNAYLNAKTDDFNLLRFLRASKFDIEKTIEKINCFYKLRGECDAWFKDRNPNLDEIDELLKIGLFLPLLRRDTDGTCVIIIRPVKHDPKIHSIDNVFKVGFMILDLFFEKFPFSSVYGVRAIFDMDGINIGHARQLTIPIIKRAVHSWQVHIHGHDLTVLHNRISKEILPKEYGGSNGKLEELIIHWRREILENSLWYQQDELFKCTTV